MKFYLRSLLPLVFLLFVGFSANAEVSDVMGLELADRFKDVEIVTSAKESESAFKIAASTFVLTSDDIRRSGATCVPEALRMVPGIEVSRASSNQWSVTSRGFANVYDNRILVMVDGREIYSPAFPLINWDASELVMDDIDRIEIIRGPSPTLWGYNNLNGVIHIITKKAQYTQGNYASALYGNQERIFDYRYGGKNERSDLFYRIYAKKLNRDALKNVDTRGNVGGSANDGWGMSKTGFRLDWQKNARDEIGIKADAHDGVVNHDLFLANNESQTIYDREYVQGFNVDGFWNRIINDTDSFRLHSYIDKTSRKYAIFSIDRLIFNLEAEHHFKVSKNNKIKAGLGYRKIIDEARNSRIGNDDVITYFPNKLDQNFYTAFIHDQFTIIPEKLNISFGTKFQHHYTQGSDFMPDARASWTPNDDNTLWLSASKGVRNPSRFESGMRNFQFYQDNRKIYFKSDENFKSEKVISYEAGYRNRSLSFLELSLSAFYNQYSKLRTFSPDLVANQQYVMRNQASATSSGFDVVADLALRDDWSVMLGYSYIDINAKIAADANDFDSELGQGASPHHQIKIKSHYNVTRNIDLDAGFYYVGSLNIQFAPQPSLIESYKRFDLRLAWRPRENLELSLVGQRLFYGDTREMARMFYQTQNAVYGNAVYGQVRWGF